MLLNHLCKLLGEVTLMSCRSDLIRKLSMEDRTPWGELDHYPLASRSHRQALHQLPSAPALFAHANGSVVILASDELSQTVTT